MSHLVNLKPVLSYPERLMRWLPWPFWLSWLLFWVGLFAVDLLISQQDAHSSLTELGVVLFCASVTIGLGFTTRKVAGLYHDLALFIDADQQELSAWYSEKLSWIYSGLWPLLTGIGFAALVEALVGAEINTFSINQPGVLYFRMTYRLLGFFFLGMSLWSLVNVMFLPSQLLQFKLTIRLSNFSGLGLQALGNTFFGLSLISLASFTMLVAAILVSPLRDDRTVILLSLLGSLLIFLFFLLPQIGIHRIMAMEKRQQILYYAQHLDEAIRKSHEDPNLANMQKLRELLDVQKHLREVNDWPFNVTVLWQLVSALLIPLLLVLLQAIFKI